MNSKKRRKKIAINDLTKIVRFNPQKMALYIQSLKTNITANTANY